MSLTIDRPPARARTARRPAPTEHALRLEPARRGRRVRVPELVLGVLLVGGGAFAALAWHTSSTARVAVTVLASPVAAGEVIDDVDLRPAEVALGEGVVAVAWEGRQQLVGRTAAAALPAGALLTPGLVTDVPALAAGEALVGLRLAPEAHPAGNLERGDAVAVVVAAGPPGSGQDGGTLASSATVWDVSALADQQASVLVTLRMPEADAAAVSAVADQVRVVRVVR
jgi:hypothetical protein